MKEHLGLGTQVAPVLPWLAMYDFNLHRSISKIYFQEAYIKL